MRILADPDHARHSAHQGLSEGLASANGERTRELDDRPAKTRAGTRPNDAQFTRGPLIVIDRIKASLFRVRKVVVRSEPRGNLEDASGMLLIQSPALCRRWF